MYILLSELLSQPTNHNYLVILWFHFQLFQYSRINLGLMVKANISHIDFQNYRISETTKIISL